MECNNFPPIFSGLNVYGNAVTLYANKTSCINKTTHHQSLSRDKRWSKSISHIKEALSSGPTSINHTTIQIVHERFILAF